MDSLSFQKLLDMVQDDLDFDLTTERMYWENASLKTRIHNDRSLRFIMTMAWQSGEKVVRCVIDEVQTGKIYLY